MKFRLTLVALIFTISLIAQTTETKTATQKKATTTQKSSKKKPFTSHSGPGLENTGTSAITITHNDTVNYQGNGKPGTFKKTVAKKKAVKTT